MNTKPIPIVKISNLDILHTFKISNLDNAI